MSKSVVSAVGSMRISRSLPSVSAPCATEPNTRAFRARCASTTPRIAARWTCKASEGVIFYASPARPRYSTETVSYAEHRAFVSVILPLVTSPRNVAVDVGRKSVAPSAAFVGYPDTCRMYQVANSECLTIRSTEGAALFRPAQIESPETPPARARCVTPRPPPTWWTTSLRQAQDRLCRKCRCASGCCHSPSRCAASLPFEPHFKVPESI